VAARFGGEEGLGVAGGLTNLSLIGGALFGSGWRMEGARWCDGCDAEGAVSGSGWGDQS
jgi:hypothetical protein